ncbi:MAG: ribosomal protein S18-alanine N-acetyltransferase [Selenomonadaceae bacterium]|nr:ribosomal protein S18-alanine N-acetyltransferase [Selenomonadaceae bacterium]
MNITVKEATLTDVAEIVKIEQACFSTPWTEQGISESIENENTHLYIALADGTVAGYMGVQIFSGEGYVTNVATLPEYRRKGVAKALIERVLQNEMDFLTLEVRESNAPAIALYESIGFERVGVRPHFYRNPDENAVLMTIELSEQSE